MTLNSRYNSQQARQDDNNKFELSEGDYEPIKKSFISSVVGAIKSSIVGRSGSQNVGRSRSLIPDGDKITGQYLPNARPSASQGTLNDYSGHRHYRDENGDYGEQIRSRLTNFGLDGHNDGYSAQSMRSMSNSGQHSLYQPKKVIIPAQLYQAYKQYKQQQSSTLQGLLAVLDQQSEQIRVLESQNEQLLQKAEEMRSEYVRLAKEATVTAVKFPSRVAGKNQTGLSSSLGVSGSVAASTKPAETTTAKAAENAAPKAFSFNFGGTSGQSSATQSTTGTQPVAQSAVNFTNSSNNEKQSQQTQQAQPTAPLFTFGSIETQKQSQQTENQSKGSYSFQLGAAEKPKDTAQADSQEKQEVVQNQQEEALKPPVKETLGTFKFNFGSSVPGAVPCGLYSSGTTPGAASGGSGPAPSSSFTFGKQASNTEASNAAVPTTAGLTGTNEAQETARNTNTSSGFTFSVPAGGTGGFKFNFTGAKDAVAK